MKNIAVILAGGVGSRLWPLSTEAHPKYLLSINEEEIILSRHLNELSKLGFYKIVLITSHHAYESVEQVIRQAGIDNLDIFIEPLQKNTAPSLIYAAEIIKNSILEDCNLMVFPSDAYISAYSFIKDLIEKFKDSSNDFPIISAVKVDKKPSSQFGYILGKKSHNNLYKTSQFIEKPNESEIKKFKGCKAYLNTGIFITKLNYFLEELERLNPVLCNQVRGSIVKDDNSLLYKKFAEIKPLSIDKVLFEKTKKHFFFELEQDWTDIGSFYDYSKLLTKLSSNKENNAIFSKDSLIQQSKNCFVLSKDKFVSIIGVENIFLVENEDNLFISSKEALKDIQGFQEVARTKFTSSALSEHTNYRPWGWYKTLEKSHFYKVKKISVSIGESISLQSHNHREEIWTIVKGNAEFYLDKKISHLSEGQSVRILKRSRHYIKNIGSSNLEFIEVQLGSYLEEDDIVRYVDKYDRKLI